MKFFKKSGNDQETLKKRKEGKSLFRRINDFLHLWLGLISGVIVLIVCVTGCIWVFNEEITRLLDPEIVVGKQQPPVLTPSRIQQVATREYPGEKLTYARYQQGEAVDVWLGDWEADFQYSLKINPYSGKVISKTTHKKDESDFFEWVLQGHRFLWMPYEIGRPIVNYATLTFVVLLITGLIWWYPKKWTQSTRDKSFKIKWDGSFKRVNLDLHNVLGFYSLLFLMMIALTGMVWGLEWYNKGLYWVTSGGEELPDFKNNASDSLQAGKFFTAGQAMDLAWDKVIKKHPDSEGFYYSYPDTTDAKSTISIIVYPSAGQFYNNQNYAFDRHTLKPLAGHKVYGANYAEAPFATKLRKMNYDIHVGSILGFPGKVLAFLASLIGASLPVTGFIIWWNRKGFGKTKGKKSAAKTRSDNKNERAAEPLIVAEGVKQQKKTPVFKPKKSIPSEISHTINSSEHS